eukprot:232759_1
MDRFHSTTAFLLFDDLEELDFVGPYEMFSLWGYRFGGPNNVITISENPLVKCSKGLKIVTDYGLDNCPSQIDYLLIPGGKGTRSQINNKKLINFIQNAPTKLKCKYILSVCTGAFLLQKAGLLSGLNATTHWKSLNRLREFKDINVIEERVVKNKNIWTSSGISSGIDLALEFIAFIDGNETAGNVQFWSEYYPSKKRYSDIHLTHTGSPQYLRSKL